MQRQFEHAAWHADLPAFQDFGMELADEADGLIADEYLRGTAFEKRGMAVGVQPVRLVQIQAQELQKRMAFGETGARVGAERAQPELALTAGFSRHIQDRDFANL